MFLHCPLPRHYVSSRPISFALSKSMRVSRAHPLSRPRPLATRWPMSLPNWHSVTRSLISKTRYAIKMMCVGCCDWFSCFCVLPYLYLFTLWTNYPRIVYVLYRYVASCLDMSPGDQDHHGVLWAVPWLCGCQNPAVGFAQIQPRLVRHWIR